MNFLHRFVIVGTLAFVLCGCGGGAMSAGIPGVNPPVSGSVPQVAHVLLLVEENHSYNSVVGSASMPYFNQLASQYALATEYFADAHPSLPNYFMLTTGQTLATSDSYSATVTQDNVVRALTAAGKSWRYYGESLPSAGYTGGDSGSYSKQHDPFAYFSEVLSDSSQANNLVPFAQFSSDLENDALPDYAFIVPDLTDDAHNCPAGESTCTDEQKLAAADQWLQANLDPFVKSSAFASSLLIITFDEGGVDDNAHGGGQVATLIVSPKAKAGYRSSTFYEHAGTLRLSMKAAGVTDFPGAAASAPDMGEFFQ